MFPFFVTPFYGTRKSVSSTVIRQSLPTSCFFCLKSLSVAVAAAAAGGARTGLDKKRQFCYTLSAFGVIWKEANQWSCHWPTHLHSWKCHNLRHPHIVIHLPYHYVDQIGVGVGINEHTYPFAVGLPVDSPGRRADGRTPRARLEVDLHKMERDQSRCFMWQLQYYLVRGLAWT